MAKKTVLVVDDEPDLRDLMQDILEMAGFEPILAKNGADMRKQLKSHGLPDILILDLVLGDENGLTLYKKLIAEKELDENIPVLVISALAGDIEQTYPDEAHKFALVAKPFDAEQIVAQINAAWT